MLQSKSSDLYCCDAVSGKCHESWPRYEPDFKGLVAASRKLIYSWDSRANLVAWKVTFGCQPWRFLWNGQNGG
jgi:hypothetical protein